jgi:hypothetical protein
MNTFKRKALFTAVVAGLGVAGSAEAVFIAPNNTGQALLYPYYTVQNNGTNSWNTYLSIVNTTDMSKAIKVRILEGRTSAEVLDFNLFLSPNDVWTAAIVPSDATDGSAGRILTADASCTAPAIPAAGEPFRNFQYVGQAAALGRGLDRTREGYVEMIEMASFVPGSDTDVAVTHVSGVPADCDFVRDSSVATIVADAIPPTGGLMGTGTLINVNSGLDAGYRPNALEAFSDTVIYTDPGDIIPSLADPSPTSSVVFNSGYPGGGIGGMVATVYRTDFTDGSHVLAGGYALASVFMHESIMNEYVLDTAAGSLTDWVVTQPIKSVFVDENTAAAPYTAVLDDVGACEEVEFSFFDREERSAVAGGIDFSPRPPAGDASSICWETTVLSIRNGAAHMPTGTTSGVLASRNTTSISITDTFQNGWANLRFIGANATGVGIGGLVIADSDATTFEGGVPPTTFLANPTVYVGLPVTGFMIRTFSNGGLTCDAGACQGNYASIFDHAYRNNIAP